MSECLSGCVHRGRVLGHDEGGMAFAGYGTLVLRVRGHTSSVCCARALGERRVLGLCSCRITIL